jgi:hypothetical protein
MSRQPSVVKRAESMMKAAKRAGIELARIEINADGKISMVTGKPVELGTEGSTALDNWIEKDNARKTKGH